MDLTDEQRRLDDMIDGQIEDLKIERMEKEYGFDNNQKAEEMEDRRVQLNEQFKKALSFEDKVSKFDALSKFSSDVEESILPETLKGKMITSAQNFQMSIVDLM